MKTAKDTEKYTDSARPDQIDYLSDHELAARYAVSPLTVRRWAERGSFPAPVKLGPNCKRWRRSDVIAWERARNVETMKAARG